MKSPRLSLAGNWTRISRWFHAWANRYITRDLSFRAEDWRQPGKHKILVNPAVHIPWDVRLSCRSSAKLVSFLASIVSWKHLTIMWPRPLLWYIRKHHSSGSQCHSPTLERFSTNRYLSERMEIGRTLLNYETSRIQIKHLFIQGPYFARELEELNLLLSEPRVLKDPCWLVSF